MEIKKMYHLKSTKEIKRTSFTWRVFNYYRGAVTWLNFTEQFAERTLSSASKGRWSKISSGSVSAAITTNSDIPLFKVLVAAQNNTTYQLLLRHRQSKPTRLIDIQPKKKKSGTFVGALLQLLVISGLLDEIEDSDGQLRIGERVCFRINSFPCLQARKKKNEATKWVQQRKDRNFRVN